MKRRRLLCLVALLVASTPGAAFDLPPYCAQHPGVPDLATPVAELRARVEALFETDPATVVSMLCTTIPRVEGEYGPQSQELAWWVGSLATPLIAYFDKHDEAIPLLEFALPIYERELGPYASEVSDVYVAYAWINFRKGLMKEAGEAWEKALGVREHNPGPKEIELQKVLVGLAQVRLSQRDFAAARAALDRANAILVENGESVSEAAAAIENAYTNLAMREEDYAVARRHAEKQLEIERQLDRTSAQLVTANVAYAQILEQLDEFEAAEAALRQAIALAEADEDAPLQRHHLTALTQLADTLNRRGKPAEAITFASRAVEVGRATLGAEAPRMVKVYDIRAEVAHALGEWSAALADYASADQILDAHADDVEVPTLISHHRGKGALYAAVGDINAARKALREALEAAGDDPRLATERAQTLLAMSHLSRFFSIARQRDYLNLAKQLLEKKLPHSHPDILRVVNELCALELAADSAPSCDDARQRYAAARALDPALAAQILDNLSRRAEHAGDAPGAYDYAVAALGTAAAFGTPDTHWRALIRLAQIVQQRGDGELAIFLGKQAIVEIERLRSSFIKRDYEFERGFITDKTIVYRSLADWLFAAQRIDEGIEILGLLRIEELNELLLRGGEPSGYDQAVTFSPAEATLRESYRRLFERSGESGEKIEHLDELRKAGRISSDEAENFEALLEQQFRQTPDTIGRLKAWVAEAIRHRSRVSDRTEHPQMQSAVIERLRRRFGPGTAFAAYLVTEAGIRTVVATDAGLRDYSARVQATELRRQIGRFIADIGSRSNVDGSARSLYDLLFAPVDRDATAANAQRVVIWPDDALRYLPFAALHDGTAYVHERHVVQIFSGSAAEDWSAGYRVNSIRGLGATRGAGELKALPGIVDELCSIIAGPIAGLEVRTSFCSDDGRGQGVIAGEGYVDRQFTAERLYSVLRQRQGFSLLHLGTHFELYPGNALRSSLLLGDGARLALSDIAQMDFDGLELVALSACQTGLGGALSDDGREVEGLSAVVLRRGARRVLASLWLVEDTSTARFMQHFYRELQATQGEAALALRRASAALRANSEYKHPFYWAGFFVAGDRA